MYCMHYSAVYLVKLIMGNCSIQKELPKNVQWHSFLASWNKLRKAPEELERTWVLLAHFQHHIRIIIPENSNTVLYSAHSLQCTLDLRWEWDCHWQRGRHDRCPLLFREGWNSVGSAAKMFSVAAGNLRGGVWHEHHESRNHDSCVHMYQISKIVYSWKTPGLTAFRCSRQKLSPYPQVLYTVV